MIENERVEAGRPIAPAPDSTGVTPISLDDRLRELEANLIGWALTISGGNKSKAAELLRVKRSTLGDRINRCGLGRADHLASAATAAMPQSRPAV